MTRSFTKFARASARPLRFAVASSVAVVLTAAFAFGGSAQSGPQSVTKVDHVVIISKENRSFDHYFGKLPGVNGATQATKSDNTIVDLAPALDPLPSPFDIDHNHAAFNIAYNGGLMNGFDLQGRAYSDEGYPVALSQMSQSQIPNYWAYAKRYGLGDNAFSDWKGVSFGNNLFLFAGQSGQFEESQNFRFAHGFPKGPEGENLRDTWGCDNPEGSTVKMQQYFTGAQSSMFPCFDYQGMPNLLADHGLSWKVYTDEESNSNVHNASAALTPIRYNPALWANIVDLSEFRRDAAQGTLPAVSWVIARESEHPPLTACAGEIETTNAMNALMSGPNWNSTAVFMFWDEWGGFYDHVPPPQVDPISYGIRVPLLVISPWTRRGTLPLGGYVSHKFSSQSSILKFVSDNWELPYITPHVADPALSNLMDYFNFQPPTPPKGPMLRQLHPCPILTPEQLEYSENDPDGGD